MLFLFKQKPITYTAYVEEHLPGIAEYFPIVPSSSALPKWWKDVPSSAFNWDLFRSVTTVKGCSGIINTIKQGFIMPLWSDLAISYDVSNYKYDFANGVSKMGPHESSSAPGWMEDHHIMKIVSPWILHSSCNDTQVMMTEPHYRNTSRSQLYFNPSGILTPMRGSMGTNIFMMLRKSNTSQNLSFKAGDPLVQFIPLTNRDVKLKVEVASRKDYIKLYERAGYQYSHSNNGLRKLFNDKNK